MPDVVTKEQILETLKTIRGPDLEHDIVELGMVSDVFIADDKVYFSITVPAERAKERMPRQRGAASLNILGPRMKAILRCPSE